MSIKGLHLKVYNFSVNNNQLFEYVLDT